MGNLYDELVAKQLDRLEKRMVALEVRMKSIEDENEDLTWIEPQTRSKHDVQVQSKTKVWRIPWRGNREGPKDR